MLEEAIKAAAQANIIMFCSASDDIQAGGKDSLPFRAAPDYIFRIGAAPAQGQRDPHSEDTNHISYFFPGNQVAEPWNPRSADTVRYHDGSSVATALAAGLASLIIYCTTVVRAYHEVRTSPAKAQSYSRFSGALKLRKGMKAAFDNIESESWAENKKYLPVWAVFGVAADKIVASEGDKKLDELDVLVTDLCSRIVSKVEAAAGGP